METEVFCWARKWFVKIQKIHSRLHKKMQRKLSNTIPNSKDKAPSKAAMLIMEKDNFPSPNPENK